MHRVVTEALALDLPDDVLDNYLYNNAPSSSSSDSDDRES